MAKGKGKARKQEVESEEEGEQAEEDDEEEDDEEQEEEQGEDEADEADEADEEDEDDEGDAKMAGAVGGAKKVQGPINMKKLSSFQDKLEKTGVVYMSRVPPYMKAQKIRHLLSAYGEIGRIYLTPEDPAIRKKRKAMGGNKKQVCTWRACGWPGPRCAPIAWRRARAGAVNRVVACARGVQ